MGKANIGEVPELVQQVHIVARIVVRIVHACKGLTKFSLQHITVCEGWDHPYPWHYLKLVLLYYFHQHHQALFQISYPFTHSHAMQPAYINGFITWF